MPQSLLITQCLQNDFVAPIGRYEPLPNALHVGHAESRRLMGDDPSKGPVGTLMHWAQNQPQAALAMVHIRDWHDLADAGQAEHLSRFGAHCVQGTPGAEFVFSSWFESLRGELVNATTLNDFDKTTLERALVPYADQTMHVGIVGVWTEAKITFLAYELATRYPRFKIGICSALTASSSRSAHFLALDQLTKLLGVEVLSSVGSFVRFLGGDGADLPLPEVKDRPSAAMEFDGKVNLTDDDEKLLKFLFRGSRSAKFKVLDGGFSGNLVLGSESQNLEGVTEVPHVAKIGPQEMIGKERAAFERIESVLGNAAPQIVDFADLGDRGAIKYRYASMSGAFASTFQKLYIQGTPLDRCKKYADRVFGEILGRFYSAKRIEPIDLLDTYSFDSRFAPGVRRRVEKLLGTQATGETISVLPGHEVANLCRFYEQDLDQFDRTIGDSAYVSYVHGDLNGANIIVDGDDNVWVIDFFHTARSHVLKDLIKLENDLLYIFTSVASDEALNQALYLSELITDIDDLRQPLPEPDANRLTEPSLLRVYEMVRHLRGFYPKLVETDRDPLQFWVGQLRYAAHTLGFDECDRNQRLWALHTASLAAKRVTKAWNKRGPLRLDWLRHPNLDSRQLALTILPGRRDHGRSIDDDLGALKDAKISRVVSLITDEEYLDFGVSGLTAALDEANIQVFRLPIIDQGVPSAEAMASLIADLDGWLVSGEKVLVHCVGGLGRSGTVAACLLASLGVSPGEAVVAVRKSRSPRAIESTSQLKFVHAFGSRA